MRGTRTCPCAVVKPPPFIAGVVWSGVSGLMANQAAKPADRLFSACRLTPSAPSYLGVPSFVCTVDCDESLAEPSRLSQYYAPQDDASMEPHMKPSSKIAPLALLAMAGLWPAAGLARPAGHGFAAPPRGPQTVLPGVHPGHPGKAVMNGQIRPGFRRFQQAGFAYGWGLGYDGSGFVPNAYPPAYAEAPQPPFYPGPYYQPGLAPYACSKPLIIKIGAEKTPRNLPRVTYGTPSMCPG
jgi:hypothetical protein